MSGYLTVTIGWQLAKAGVSVGAIAALVAASFIPHTWKFLWAPIADTTLNNRAWYLISGILSAAGVAATGLVPPTQHNVPLLTAVVVVANLAVTFVGMTTQSMMAHAVPEEQKGRAGGWFQAGNLGGGGIGGGAGLWLAERIHQQAAPGIILGIACALCLAALPFVNEPEHERPAGSIVKGLTGVVKDIWHLACSKPGLLALILCFLPIGSGAASGLWSAVASDWKASANTVAFATGVLSGLIMALGCLIGGWMCDRMDRKNAYMLFGVAQALCAVAMAVLPHTERWYFVMTSAYSLVTGLTYAGFTAFVLEAMGLGAAATKFSLYSSLSNTPIAYMTTVDGWAHGRFGPSGMLYAEAIAGAIGLVFFILVRATVTRGALGASRLREHV
jgi:MFS family permease